MTAIIKLRLQKLSLIRQIWLAIPVTLIHIVHLPHSISKSITSNNTESICFQRDIYPSIKDFDQYTCSTGDQFVGNRFNFALQPDSISEKPSHSPYSCAYSLSGGNCGLGKIRGSQLISPSSEVSRRRLEPPQHLANSRNDKKSVSASSRAKLRAVWRQDVIRALVSASYTLEDGVGGISRARLGLGSLR